MHNKKRIACLSVDTDSLSDVYSAYHKNDIPDNNITYTKILPRYLRLFKKYNIKATFFIIGNQLENKKNSKILSKLISQGHELANHSYSHPFNFSRLSKQEKTEEIRKCQDIIQDTTGYKTVGFRAPAWDIDSETLSILDRLKYQYDSSLFPSYFSYLAQIYQIIIARKMTMSKSLGRLSNILNSFSPHSIYHPSSKHIWRRGNLKVVEIPMSTSPYLKIPFYGTFHLSLKSRYLFESTLKSLVKSKSLLNYELHSMELYDNKRDKVDKRIKSLNHPSFIHSFEYKLNFYNYLFKKLSKYYNLKPLREAATSINSK